MRFLLLWSIVRLSIFLTVTIEAWHAPTTKTTTVVRTKTASCFPLELRHQRRASLALAAEASDTSSADAASSSASSSSSSTAASSSTSSIPDLRGKTIYQRAFYRFTPTTDADIYNAMVIEERLRFQVKDDDPTTVLPFGPRTLILRNGQVEDGKIGKEFCTLNVQEELHATNHRCGLLVTGSGRKPNASWISTLATALYMAANPTSLGQGRVLQLSCDLGLAGLLGCIGASYVLQQQQEQKTSDGEEPKEEDDENANIEDDILTFSRDQDKLLSKQLKLLALTDDFQPDGNNEKDLQRMELVLLNLEHAVGPHGAHQVVVKPLDWTSKQQQHQPGRGSGGGGGRNLNQKPFTTIIASDVATRFPYAKALANTVAHALAPSAPYYFAQDQLRSSLSSSSSKIKAPSNVDNDDDDDWESRILPRFVHIAPEEHGDEVAYLHRFLQQGYKMQVNVGFLKVERIIFALQTVDTSTTSTGGIGTKLSSPAAEEALLDAAPEPLEVVEVQEFILESTTATHDARYAGGGSGEIFFPMETGEYDKMNTQAYLETEWDRK